MVISPVHYIAVPLLAAFVIPLFAKLNREFVRIIPGIVLLYLSYVSIVLMNQVSSTGTISEVLAGWAPPFGINLVFSAFSGFLASLMTFMGLVIWIYSYRFKKIDDEPALKFYVLFLMLITGAIGIVLTGDIFNLFVFLEIVGISAYSLTSFYRNRDGAEAGFKYLLLGAFASTLILLGIILLYSSIGTLNMADIAQKSHLIPTSLKVSIFILFVVGFGIEAEMFPLNGWAPDAYSQAPGPVGAAFSGIAVKAGMYVIIRLIYTLFDIEGSFQFLIVMGLITTIIAEVSAMKQTNLKRMLAYSSIGQMGIVMVAFGIGTREAIIAGLFLMLNHAIIKGLLFLSSSYLVYNDDNKLISSLSGLGKRLPLVSFLFALGAFAIVGLPPFSGFWSRLYLLLAAADKELIYLIAIILIIAVIEIVYYFRVINKLYFKDIKVKSDDVQKPSINAVISMSILGILIIAIGIYPDLVTSYLGNAADALLDKAGYIENVLVDINN